MPYRWLLAVAVAGTFIGAGASVASAAQSPRSVAAFRKAAATLQKESVPFSNMLQQSSAPSLSRLQSVCKAEAPFIKVFDTSVGKIVFTGKTRNDIKALIQLDNEEIALLAQVKSVSSFAKGYPPISNKLGQLQIALGKDLGIQPAEV
ncbi:MAG: hypothetical protein ABSE77_20680 [Acidimicrobiales bacterium]